MERFAPSVLVEGSDEIVVLIGLHDEHQLQSKFNWYCCLAEDMQ
jgi:hypothetical protein